LILNFKDLDFDTFPIVSLPCFLLLICYLLPDLLILGLGASVLPISPETKRHINSLGIRVEVQDTRNAAAQFNLLATERGVTDVAAAMIPIGWRGDRRTDDLRNG
jgi:hypothetical protein